MDTGATPPGSPGRWTVTVMTAAARRSPLADAARALDAPADARVAGEGACLQWPLPASMAPGMRQRAAAWREHGVDLVVLPGDPTPRRLLVADMDSTMIGQECLDELAEVWGVGARVRQVTERAMAGELDFAAALHERVALLAGAPASLVDEVLHARIRPAAGAQQLVAGMRRAGARCVLVSGGFTAFSGPVAAQLDMDAHHANVLEVRDGLLTGRVVPPVLGQEAKVERLERERGTAGLAAWQVVAVGDGANDLGMLRAAGLAVALHAKPAVADEVERWEHGARIDHADASAVLWLQGLG
ncbi:phosphoserine phosphatase SerB [Kytococcus sedentarius]|uniref:phosphoserine phosphatase SerB n=1 Tax=Kytococcus sedentarius TaxID=1276 RepID=UPI0035BBC42F